MLTSQYYVASIALFRWLQIEKFLAQNIVDKKLILDYSSDEECQFRKILFLLEWMPVVCLFERLLAIMMLYCIETSKVLPAPMLP